MPSPTHQVLIMPDGKRWRQSESTPFAVDSTGWNNFNFRYRIPNLGFSVSGNPVRLSLTSATGTSGFSVSSFYFGSAGTGANFSGDQVQVFVGGSGSFSVAQNTTVVTDAFAFNLNKSNAHISSCFFNATSSIRGINTDTNFVIYFDAGAGSDEAANTTVSGYTTQTIRQRLVGKVEVWAV